MQESFGARPTLICERLEGRVQSGAEVFGGKGVQMELLHRRLGHTCKRGLERLVKDGLGMGCFMARERKWGYGDIAMQVMVVIQRPREAYKLSLFTNLSQTYLPLVHL